MPVSRHNHAVHAFPPDGPDQSLHKSVLPRALRGRKHFGDAHFSHAVSEKRAIERIAISDQVPWTKIFRKRFSDLLRSPRRRMLGDIEMNHAAPTVSQDYQNEEDPKSRGRHGEEIDRNELVHVVREEGLPGLGRGACDFGA
jgi:hypothetical protein